MQWKTCRTRIRLTNTKTNLTLFCLPMQTWGHVHVQCYCQVGRIIKISSSQHPHFSPSFLEILNKVPKSTRPKSMAPLVQTVKLTNHYCLAPVAPEIQNDMRPNQTIQYGAKAENISGGKCRNDWRATWCRVRHHVVIRHVARSYFQNLPPHVFSAFLPNIVFSSFGPSYIFRSVFEQLLYN